MKKIIIAFEGTNFSEGAFHFAQKLNELQPVLLTGIFLPQTELANLWSYATVSGNSLTIPLLEENESEAVEKNMKRFEQLCKQNSIEYCIHKDFLGFALPELKRESRYADLLLLSSEKFYNQAGSGAGETELEIALHDVECPVLLVPEKIDLPESIILAYDGSDDAVFAIKQFAYLFPEFASKETLLVFASKHPEKEFPDKILIQELAARHFGHLAAFKLDMDPKKYFESWAIEKNAPLLVCGSYGRSGLSRLFQKSFIRNIIAEHQFPIFIAHQ